MFATTDDTLSIACSSDRSKPKTPKGKFRRMSTKRIPKWLIKTFNKILKLIFIFLKFKIVQLVLKNECFWIKIVFFYCKAVMNVPWPEGAFETEDGSVEYGTPKNKYNILIQIYKSFLFHSTCILNFSTNFCMLLGVNRSIWKSIARGSFPLKKISVILNLKTKFRIANFDFRFMQIFVVID